VQKKELQTRPPYAIGSVDNALRLLQMLRDSGELRVSDAAAELGVAQSTAHRLLAMLVYRGFAVQDEGRVYQPGPGIGTGAAGPSWARRLRDVALPHLELLSGRLAETVNLMLRVGTKVRFLVSVEAQTELHVGDRQGTVLPARLASGGRALLAELDEPALRRLYRTTSSDIAGEFLDHTAWAELVDELAKVRRLGYAVNVEDTETGVAAIGMALRTGSTVPVAAFSVSTPRARFKRLFTDRRLELIAATRRDVEQDAAGIRTD